MKKPAIPPQYAHLLTGDRGEDFNQTIEDIAILAKKALQVDARERADLRVDGLRAASTALQAICAICYAAGTDPVE